MLLAQRVLDARQRFGGRLQQEALCRLVAGHRRAGEVVAAGVMDVLGHAGHERVDVDHAGFGHRFRGRDLRWRVGAGGGGDCREGKSEKACGVFETDSEMH